MTLLALLTAGALGAVPATKPIVGGDEAPGGEFGAVVGVDVPTGGCTGTLVRRDVVLTAAHCLDDLSGPDVIRVTNAPRMNTGWVGAVRYGVHPCFENPECIGEERYDYGFIQLEQEIDVEPIEVLRDQGLWDDLVQPGVIVTFVGYGEDDDGVTGTRRAVQGALEGLSANGLEFRAGGQGSDTCRGDSGGPVLVYAPDTTWRVLGVTARGSATCGEGGTYGVAFHALAWLTLELEDTSLCGEQCTNCGCLDTRPVEDERGCAVQTTTPAEWAGVGVVLLCLWQRRRLSPWA
ncbi:MAG: trypsin-like serine protease [Myxococcota bacterium]